MRASQLAKQRRLNKRASAYVTGNGAVVGSNYNDAADYTRARANHSTNHGIPVRYVEAWDASGKDVRRMRVVETYPVYSGMVHKDVPS